MENTSDERVSFWRVNKNHMHAFFYGLNSTVEDNSKQNRQNQQESPSSGLKCQP